jgi:serum/glucocorticoid-regulated kinase 2
MHFAFQDYDNLYLIMDLLNGGDLRYHVSRYKKFTEQQTSIVYIIKNSLLLVL